MHPTARRIRGGARGDLQVEILVREGPAYRQILALTHRKNRRSHRGGRPPAGRRVSVFGSNRQSRDAARHLPVLALPGRG